MMGVLVFYLQQGYELCIICLLMENRLNYGANYANTTYKEILENLYLLVSVYI